MTKPPCNDWMTIQCTELMNHSKNSLFLQALCLRRKLSKSFHLPLTVQTLYVRSFESTHQSLDSSLQKTKFGCLCPVSLRCNWHTPLSNLAGRQKRPSWFSGLTGETKGRQKGNKVRRIPGPTDRGGVQPWKGQDVGREPCKHWGAHALGPPSAMIPLKVTWQKPSRRFRRA